MCFRERKTLGEKDGSNFSSTGFVGTCKSIFIPAHWGNLQVF